MQQVPADTSAAFQRRLDQAQVPADQRQDYQKWVCFYLDFCTKYGHSPALPTSLGPFLSKLAAKNQSVGQRNQGWQWFFAAANLTSIAAARERRRYHLHDSHVQGAVKQAAAAAGIPKRVSPHTFRHTYASHLLLANYDLQTTQRLLGHSDIKTTMIYLQTVPSVTLKEAKSRWIACENCRRIPMHHDGRPLSEPGIEIWTRSNDLAQSRRREPSATEVPGCQWDALKP